MKTLMREAEGTKNNVTNQTVLKMTKHGQTNGKGDRHQQKEKMLKLQRRGTNGQQQKTRLRPQQTLERTKESRIRAEQEPIRAGNSRGIWTADDLTENNCERKGKLKLTRMFESMHHI